MQRVLEIAFRFFGGGMLLFFAFAPAWILFHLAKTLVVDPRDLGLLAAVAFFVCSALLYFLLLLAYRAFTGRGRAQDGGLLPPWALKLCAGAFGIVAVSITIFGMYQGEVRAIVGGIGYLASAAALYGVVLRRMRSRNA